jgi:hypothetical protein
MTTNVNGSGTTTGRRALASLGAFRELKDRPIIQVDVPEFKENPDDPDEEMPFVYMKAPTDAQKEEWQYRSIAELPYEPDREKALERDRSQKIGEVLHRNRPDLISMCIVDEKGKRIFRTEDIETIADRNAAAVARLYLKARELCGIDAPKPVLADIVKNSKGGPSGSSSSGSVPPPVADSSTQTS